MNVRYHYKSPEEVKRKIEESRSIVRPFRNRTFAFVLVDTLLIIVIFLVVHYTTGVFLDTVQSKYDVPFENLEFSASASGLGRGEENRKFFLKIRNNGDKTIIFPGDASPFRLNHSWIQMRLPGDLVSHPVEIFLEKRSIQPGETELYVFRPALELPKKPTGFQFIMEFADRKIEVGTE